MAKVACDNGDSVVVVSPIDGVLRQEYLDIGIPVIIDKSIYHTTGNDFSTFEYYARNFDLVVVNSLASGRAVLALLDSLPPVIWWIHESPIAYDEFKHCLPKELPPGIKAYTVSDYSANSLNKAGLSYDFGRLVYGTPDRANSTQERAYGHRPAPDMKQELVTFLTIGSIEYRKAHDILINALKLVSKEQLKKAQFVFIGSSNDHEINKMCIQAKNAFGNITMLENIPGNALWEQYKKSDCLIIPSREDPLPGVATEAMMFGKPVICSDNTGTADYITQFETGIVFPNENAEKLAEYITFAINNRTAMALMGQNARKDIYEKYFTLETFKKSVLELIDEVLSGS
jgi:glycosyltransferase involved in cell wall biosynthesis